MPVRKIKDFPKAFKNFKEDLCPMGIRRVLFLKSEWNDFTKSKGVSILYLLYRALYMIYFQGSVFYSMRCRIDYYFTYVTYWTLMMQAIYGTLFFIEVFYHYILEKCKKEDYAEMDHLLPSSLTALEKAIWVLFSIVSVTPVIISLVFWILVHPAMNSNPDFVKVLRNCDKVASVLSHFGNSVFCVLDLSINALPVHVTHFIYLSIYATIYIAFTGVYEVAYGKYPYNRNYIYDVLDWRAHPALAAGMSMGIVIAGIIVHLILWTVYIFRLFIVNLLLRYDVYSYHEYTYRTKGNTPYIRSEMVIEEIPANLPKTKEDDGVIQEQKLANV